MAELQRSVTTFRRSGSSGLVWDERLISGEADQTKEEEEEEDDEDEGAAAASAAEFRELRHSKSVGSIGMMARSRSTGRHAAFRASIVPPAADPPSPDVPRCCGFFGKHRSAETSRPRRR